MVLNQQQYYIAWNLFSELPSLTVNSPVPAYESSRTQMFWVLAFSLLCQHQSVAGPPWHKQRDRHFLSPSLDIISARLESELLRSDDLDNIQIYTIKICLFVKLTTPWTAICPPVH